MIPPCSVNFSALPMRFCNTWLKRVASPGTIGRGKIRPADVLVKGILLELRQARGTIVIRVGSELDLHPSAGDIVKDVGGIDRVKIIHPTTGAIYSPEKDEWVSIGVDAADNVSMGRVEFYVDGVKTVRAASQRNSTFLSVSGKPCGSMFRPR